MQGGGVKYIFFKSWKIQTLVLNRSRVFVKRADSLVSLTFSSSCDGAEEFGAKMSRGFRPLSLYLELFIDFSCPLIKTQAKTHWIFSIFILYCRASFWISIHCCQGSSCSPGVDTETTETSAKKPSSEFKFKCLGQFSVPLPPETISHKIIEPLLYCHCCLNLTNCTWFSSIWGGYRPKNEMCSSWDWIQKHDCCWREKHESSQSSDR